MDRQTCYRALKSRDARFDGRFFTAVLTTGVYCRPICPARTPKLGNVRFYACAAAAQSAGFRPCTSCKPAVPQRQHHGDSGFSDSSGQPTPHGPPGALRTLTTPGLTAPMFTTVHWVRGWPASPVPGCVTRP